MKTVKLTGALFCAGSILSPAMAQQPPANESMRSNAAPSTAATAPSAAEDPNAPADIIVTALKGSTSLQRTPAAISVVSGEEIAKRQIADIRSLGPLIPSLKTNVEGTATQIFARGVGKQVDLGHIPDAVGMVIDGLSISQSATGMALFDVSSVQVLPGPQGTLYGSSAIGGIINVTTNRPTDDTSGSALLEAGNYGSVHATITQNIPVTDNWHLRAVYNGNYRDGYNKDGTFNDNMTAFRLSSLYEPDDSFSWLVTGTYAFDRFKLSTTVPYPFISKNPYNTMPFDPDTAIFYPPNGGVTGNGRVHIDIATVTTEIEKRIGDITVTYTGGYLNKRTPGPNDGPGFNEIPVAGFSSQYQSNIDLFNNELKISNGKSSRLSWIAGLYQLHSRTREFYVFGPNFSGQDYATIMQTYAAYGQGTYSVLEGTRITAGIRVSKDSVSAGKGAVVFFPIFPTLSRGVIPFSYDRGWTKLNWKVGIEQDISSTSMFYAGAQSGFNPGTFDGNAPSPGNPVKPQSMIGYTAGMKNRFFDSRLTFNFEGYLYNYKDQIIQAPNLATGTTILINAQKSRIYGFQLDSAFQATDTTQLRANLGYLNATFRKFNYVSGGTLLDFKGYTLPFAPKFTVNLGATQTVHLGEKGSIEARVDSYLTNSYWFTYDNIPTFKQHHYSKTDASITYRPPSERWEIGIWAKNLENKATAASSGTSPGRSYPGVVYLEPPRTYGGRLLVKW